MVNNFVTQILFPLCLFDLTACEVKDPELPCMTEGSEVLEKYDFDEDNYWSDISFMAVIYVVFHGLGYACLWNRARYK